MTSENVSRYIIPQHWIRYDAAAVFNLLVEAKSAAAVLRQMPYLRQWIEQAHEEQLRLEAAGTSRIEGAEFTPREQEEALSPSSPQQSGLTHSQRQLKCAVDTYRWLQTQPTGRSITSDFIREIHRRIVTGCDDHHCEPGALRPDGWNVTFGTPICRGAEGGDECKVAFNALCASIAGIFRQHDPVIQAIAAHYHIGSMHPFGDGNGRTARALEAFMLRSAGVNDVVMVSLSNYYYEYKEEYLESLNQSRQNGHDITPFLLFALRAIIDRCGALTEEITDNHRRILFREFANSLFGQLRSPRRRVLAERQLQILKILLDGDSIDLVNFVTQPRPQYKHLKYPNSAVVRDVVGLLQLGAINIQGESSQIILNLDWPQQFSESELLERYEKMPSAVSTNHPAMAELRRLLRGR